MRYLLLIFFFLFTLTGCKSEIVEISLKTKDIKTAISGEDVSIKFETTFSLLAEYDDTTKSEIKKIRNVVEEYFTIEEFEVIENDFGIDIEIEGEIPLVYVKNDSQSIETSPWVIKISDNNKKGSLENYPYKISLSNTANFNSIVKLIEDINILVTIDRFQPVKFKLRTSNEDKLQIFTGGVVVNGESFIIMEEEISKRINLTMKEGVYSDNFASFYFKILN